MRGGSWLGKLVGGRDLPQWQAGPCAWGSGKRRGLVEEEVGRCE